MEWVTLGALLREFGLPIIAGAVIVWLQSRWYAQTLAVERLRVADKQAAIDALNKTLDVRDVQLREMLDGYRTFESVLRSLEREARGRGQHDNVDR